jgi:hypothetical protein
MPETRQADGFLDWGGLSNKGVRKYFYLDPLGLSAFLGLMYLENLKIRAQIKGYRLKHNEA